MTPFTRCPIMLGATLMALLRPFGPAASSKANLSPTFGKAWSCGLSRIPKKTCESQVGDSRKPQESGGGLTWTTVPTCCCEDTAPVAGGAAGASPPLPPHGCRGVAGGAASAVQPPPPRRWTFVAATPLFLEDSVLRTMSKLTASPGCSGWPKFGQSRVFAKMSPETWSETRKPQPSRNLFTWPVYWPWGAAWGVRDLSRAPA
mmetsp:Transcript_102335/g.315792  ORF Transcript_102335/g.315792 Transcript_102335/m.315792 type:complete len:203 (-) Transcript_102335:175-783(-)